MVKTVSAQSMNVNGRLITFGRPLIMGILNLTPDSFFDGGRHNRVDDALRKAEQLIQEGAEIIDIGAYSSRPGASPISPEEETNRAMPVIRELTQTYPDIILSIDTFRADVAEACVEAGVHIINDISGGTLDKEMFSTVARLQVPYILMHIRGTPETMQTLTDYE